MSRPLVSVLLGLAILAGCVTEPPVKTSGDDTGQGISYPSVEKWLDLEQDVGNMEATQIVERLTQINKEDGVGQMFYYGVLNQHLPTYGAWTLARDTFQRLQENEDLPVELRQFSGILRKYNQVRINAYVQQQEMANKYTRLQQDLHQTEEERELLEQKLQALTELETVISTRKEE
jgi:hypothetical protein